LNLLRPYPSTAELTSTKLIFLTVKEYAMQTQYFNDAHSQYLKNRKDPEFRRDESNARIKYRSVVPEGSLPDELKTGMENLSGYSMDNVKVHYNSDKPAQLQAHAYAQGSHIHLGLGIEKHLPHEAWHVVQQKQGRVKPTISG
jgi:hypothetical protein